MKNRITDILGSEFPLILGPMRKITLGKMAATVSNSGGFGQIAASGMSAQDLVKELRIARELTRRPVGVNIPVYRKNAFEALEIAIQEGVRTITTSAGNPAKMIGRIKEAGLKVIHKVSTVEMGLKAQEAGVDGVIATGFEAGGHLGKEDITTFCLVPQLVAALHIPVVAAGGIGGGRGFLAALSLGAEGVEVGTRFIATTDCECPDWFKQSVLQASGQATLTLGKKVMRIRVLKNKKAEDIAHPDKEKEDENMILSGEEAYVNEDAEKAILPAGQVCGLITDLKPISRVFPDMMAEADRILAGLQQIFKEERA